MNVTKGGIACDRRPPTSSDGSLMSTSRVHECIDGIGRKEENVLFNDAHNTFYFTVIWKEGRKCVI